PEAGGNVAAEDLAAALHHEAGHRTRIAHDDDRPALLVDPGARAHLPLDDEVAAAKRGPRQRARVPLDHDHSGHQSLAVLPDSAAVDLDLGPVDEAAPEVAERAVEGDLAPGEDADADRVLRARDLDGDGSDPLFVEEAAKLEVDLARGEVVRVKGRLAVLHLRGARSLGVGLGEPACVVRDALLAYRCHTNTSPS